MISFVVSGVPAPKGSMRAFKSRNGKVVVTHDNPATAPWAQRVAWAARAEMRGRAPFTGPVSLRLHFYLPKPKAAVKEGRDMPCVKPDVDKLQRNVLDALSGILYSDDGQVTSVHASKEYATPPEWPPCCHIIAIVEDERITVEDLP